MFGFQIQNMPDLIRKENIGLHYENRVKSKPYLSHICLKSKE